MGASSNHLRVWWGQRPVGRLWRNSQGLIGFRYDHQWLAESKSPISISLPLRHEEYLPEESLAQRFFSNLLPEGALREQIVRELRISNSDFDLLRAIGGECAGALSILELEQTPSTKYEYLELSSQGLEKLVTLRMPLIEWRENERIRFSLAGVQNKCPVVCAKDSYFLPRDQSPTSHIIKFAPAEFRYLLIFETFTTMLASDLGLPVVTIKLKEVRGRHMVLIQRYDRYKDCSGVLARLHQEDFCQALGFAHFRKYEDDNGPSFADCYQLTARVSSNPAQDLQHLLRWQIFNVLAGNTDGHAKNLSFLYLNSGEIRLAPFYDLICTRAIANINHRLAFSVGGKSNGDFVSLKHWERMARQCDINSKFLESVVLKLAKAMSEQLQQTKSRFEKNYGNYQVLQRVEYVIAKQCRRILEQS